ncbi:receptor-like protein EIX2 [Gastrolobium bilobum]|uniref:receptor-like protein EIX2 n=1 Tax=Gastrolobium bilobum TaxID=150636 RepID=UPI002AB2E7A6|nr:receptor-like protein EIX2 [Gastrolobium bilobum]
MSSRAASWDIHQQKTLGYGVKIGDLYYLDLKCNIPSSRTCTSVRDSSLSSQGEIVYGGEVSIHIPVTSAASSLGPRLQETEPEHETQAASPILTPMTESASSDVPNTTIPRDNESLWRAYKLLAELEIFGNIPNWIPQSATALQLRSNQFSGTIPPQICQRPSLIILDFADNKISGHIPNCLDNITALISNNASQSKLAFYFDFQSIYFYFGDSLELVTKGQGSEYAKNLHFMTLIDLSNNDLYGTIPPQMFSLIGLHSLNLSHNKLMGSMPNEIGNMYNLESLDFSTNQLWGEIPQGMSNLSFLSYLNLSFNNLTGKIPSGTQLQGFSALSYIGNPNLCGSPLTKNCSSDTKYRETNPMDEHQGESEFLSWFYIGIESGFVTGFLGVCVPIFLNRKWRHAYFNFLYDTRDRLYVMMAIKMNSFR